PGDRRGPPPRRPRHDGDVRRRGYRPSMSTTARPPSRDATARAPARSGSRAARPQFRCGECGWTTSRWVGRCGECQTWGSVAEEGPTAAGPRTQATTPPQGAAVPIDEVDVTAAR